jgi:hypothetical protein
MEQSSVRARRGARRAPLDRGAVVARPATAALRARTRSTAVDRCGALDGSPRSDREVGRERPAVPAQRAHPAQVEALRALGYVQ